jgi:S1-C subfamily serine protease
VVIDPKGLILTQYLVVKPGETHFVTTSQGDRIPAEIVGADPRSGLAILRARSDKLKAVELGRAEDLKKGNLVVAIGNPYALESDGQATASYGMVSNLARKAPVGENLNETTKTEPTGQQGYATTLHHYGTLIQTDAKLGWNASGGALVTLDGKLVGLTTSVATIAGHEAPAGYAIPIDKTMRRVIDTLKEGREVEYGLLGIGFQPTAVSRLSDGAPGILVDSVYRGSAADRAGLRPGDIVAEIDGQPTANADRLQLLIGSLSPQDETHLVYERAGALEETSVRLDKIHVPGEKVVTTRPPGWQGIHIDFATAIETPLLNAASAPQGLIDSSGCVAVVDVDKDSLSWKQGVRPGMFISHVAGKRVSTPQEFRDAVREADGSVKLRFTPGNSPENAQPVAPLSE